MSQDGSERRRYGKWWLFVFILLIAAIIAGGGVLAYQHIGKSHPMEISPSVSAPSEIEVHFSGPGAHEGIYSFTEDSSLWEILGVGRRGGADLSGIRIYIPAADESLLGRPQRVNINTAEVWLLEALPGIGPTLAGRIVEYRENNGPFQNIWELDMVKGIGEKTIGNIEDKITVVD
jgi:competence protein ComEA